MNERYLFKAKRIDNGEWVTGYYAVIGGRNVIIEKCVEDYYCTDDGEVRHGNQIHEVTPSTICQCTGLKDKNGKLIWESDVVKKEFYTDYNNCANSEEYIGIVKFTGFAWVIETIRDKCTRPIFEAMTYSEDVKYLEVIGNVFDNPELLEGGEQSGTRTK